jgi:hypothetical protein
LIDLPAAALAGRAVPVPVPEPSESDHRSSKFALGLGVEVLLRVVVPVVFVSVVPGVMGNVEVRWMAVGFRGAAPNVLGVAAGAATDAGTIIACAGGLLDIEVANMPRAG